ncbi:cytochrome P450 [Streptomyces sp. Ru87]|uniref:cytochrome P450 n=1 Tax=Streptomyces sp. Ru87 TaxID=2044307 RepID=UPI000BF5BA18|nr:cytochrome P450 [Streptomyces sp. Ru87]PGH50465.1 cytochrome [Streptomyces sp. Ru87]
MTDSPPRCPRGYPKIHGAGFAADPDGVYAQLRESGSPGGWAEIAPGVYALIVTGYQAAVSLLTDTNTYSKDSRRWRALTENQVPADSPVLGMMAFRPSVLYVDDDEHARLRWAMDDCIDRIDTNQLGDITRRSARTLVSRVSEDGRADLMADFADILPMMVMADLLGCSPDEAAHMVSACQDLISAGPEAAQGASDFAGILFGLVQARRREPGNDLTSWMINHPAGLTDEESVNQLYCAVGAALIPTAAWIAWALDLLLSDDAYAGALAAGTVTVRRALDQALWERSPMANFSVHYARHDTELKGLQVPAGVPLLISHAAANRDPALPDDLGYSNKSHLAWSAGPHACPARIQATVIAEAGIETVLNELWDAKPADPGRRPELRHGPFHQCPRSMIVTFRPKRAARILSAAAAFPGGSA